MLRPEGHLPVRHALAGVADPGGRGQEEAPISRAPHVVRGEALPGLRRDSIFARRKSNQRTGRCLGPFRRKRPGHGPLDSIVGDIRNALIAEHVHPGLIAELVEHPLRLTGIQNHRRVRSGVEHGLADSFPAPDILARALALEGKQPGHGIGAPASDHIAHEQLRLIVSQRRRHVLLRSELQQRGNRAQDARLAQHLQPGIEPLEEVGIDGDAFRKADIGALLFHVLAGSNRPLGHGETLGGARFHVNLPILELRRAGPRPDRVRQPEERRAVGVFEVAVVARHAHRAVLVETGWSGGGGAKEFSGLVAQAVVGRIGAGRLECPAARLVGRKAHAPGPAPVPEPVHLAGIAQRRSELHL